MAGLLQKDNCSGEQTALRSIKNETFWGPKCCAVFGTAQRVTAFPETSSRNSDTMDREILDYQLLFVLWASGFEIFIYLFIFQNTNSYLCSNRMHLWVALFLFDVVHSLFHPFILSFFLSFAYLQTCFLTEKSLNPFEGAHFKEIIYVDPPQSSS